ncbi:MAG: TlpA family protein disulfide reductase [Sulfuritalea sp.]|nr:TlpA family protein disulfide reductase [Sulfuritalea sp.]
MTRFLLCLLMGLVALAARAQDSAPLFAASLRDIDNRRIAIADFRGQPLLVNFWARWCAPCRVEIPELSAIARTHGPKGLKVIGIGLEDNSPTVKDFVKAYEMDYLLLFAPAEGIALMRALGNERAGLPFTLAVDRNGRVVLHKLGPAARADLETAAAAALR